jgi:hypothetical protein
MEGKTGPGGNYSIAEVDGGSGNVIEVSCTGYATRTGTPFAISGDVTGVNLSTLSNESVEDFGADAVVTVITVAGPSDTDWDLATNPVTGTISPVGANKNYIINVTGAVSGINVTSVNTFGPKGNNIKVSLRGGTGASLSLVGGSGTGSLLIIGESQTVILRNVNLIGKGGNSSAVVYITGGKLVMRDGIISGNTVTSSSWGGGVNVSGGGSFTMYGGTISGNSAQDGGGVLISNGNTFTMYGGTISGNQASGSGAEGKGGGVYVSNTGSFTKTGGIIYGDSDGTNTPPENTSLIGTSGNGHAVFYFNGSKYRDSTHGPTHGTLSTSNTVPGSGWGL